MIKFNYASIEKNIIKLDDSISDNGTFLKDGKIEFNTERTTITVTGTKLHYGFAFDMEYESDFENKPEDEKPHPAAWKQTKSTVISRFFGIKPKKYVYGYYKMNKETPYKAMFSSWILVM